MSDELSPAELKQLKELLSDADKSPRLSKWERNFVGDIACNVELYGARARVSDKQREVLDRIEKKVYAT